MKEVSQNDFISFVEHKVSKTTIDKDEKVCLFFNSSDVLIGKTEKYHDKFNPRPGQSIRYSIVEGTE